MPGRAVGTQRLSILDEAQALNFVKAYRFDNLSHFSKYLASLHDALTASDFFKGHSFPGLASKVWDKARQYCMLLRPNVSMFQNFGDEMK